MIFRALLACTVASLGLSWPSLERAKATGNAANDRAARAQANSETTQPTPAIETEPAGPTTSSWVSIVGLQTPWRMPALGLAALLGSGNPSLLLERLPRNLDNPMEPVEATALLPEETTLAPESAIATPEAATVAVADAAGPDFDETVAAMAESFASDLLAISLKPATVAAAPEGQAALEAPAPSAETAATPAPAVEPLAPLVVHDPLPPVVVPTYSADEIAASLAMAFPAIASTASWVDDRLSQLGHELSLGTNAPESPLEGWQDAAAEVAAEPEAAPKLPEPAAVADVPAAEGPLALSEVLEQAPPTAAEPALETASPAEVRPEEPADEVGLAVEEPESDERFRLAVRLTGEAFQAWMTVLADHHDVASVPGALTR